MNPSAAQPPSLALADEAGALPQPLLTQLQVDALLAGRCICDAQPWGSGDALLIEAHLREATKKVAKYTGASAQIEWDHYGSGYASFVDAWFYLHDPAFRLPEAVSPGYGWQAWRGLSVLVNRLSPWFVFVESRRSWSTNGSGSTDLPSLDRVDRPLSPCVAALAATVQPLMECMGFRRATRSQLATNLPKHCRVPTILGKGPLTQFDALFHWQG